ncbi:hypothetical protein PENTCL1PPCAC_19208, partial [Pristionchus entomophagus]
FFHSFHYLYLCFLLLKFFHLLVNSLVESRQNFFYLGLLLVKIATLEFILRVMRRSTRFLVHRTPISQLLLQFLQLLILGEDHISEMEFLHAYDNRLSDQHDLILWPTEHLESLHQLVHCRIHFLLGVFLLIRILIEFILDLEETFVGRLSLFIRWTILVDSRAQLLPDENKLILLRPSSSFLSLPSAISSHGCN